MTSVVKRTAAAGAAALMLAAATVTAPLAEAHNFGRGGFTSGGGSGHGFGSFHGANQDPRAARELSDGLDLDGPGAGLRGAFGVEDDCATYGVNGFDADTCG